MSTDNPDRPSRLIAILVSVAILVTVGAIAVGLWAAGRIAESPATSPLAVPAAPQPGAGGRYCTDLMGALPAELDGSARRTLLVDEPGVAAWGDPAVVLRCGLSDPAELTCAAGLTSFTDPGGITTEWLRIARDSGVTYLAVDRPVRVAVTVPTSVGATPVQILSDLIARALPERDVCSDGHLVAADNA